jgi:stage III sporulation protein AF
MNQWISNILGVVVLGIFMDMIIPTGNTKSYARFFIGLIMLLVMIQPVVNLLGQFPSYSENLWSVKIDPELETIDTASHIIELNQEKHLQRMYKSRLEKDVIERTRLYIPDVDVTADVTLVESQGPAAYEIDSIQIILEPRDLYKIQEIEISVDLEADCQRKKHLKDTQKEIEGLRQLKKHLSETYGIEESRIHISSE